MKIEELYRKSPFVRNTILRVLVLFRSKTTSNLRYDSKRCTKIVNELLHFSFCTWQQKHLMNINCCIKFVFVCDCVTFCAYLRSRLHEKRLHKIQPWFQNELCIYNFIFIHSVYGMRRTRAKISYFVIYSDEEKNSAGNKILVNFSFNASE